MHRHELRGSLAVSGSLIRVLTAWAAAGLSGDFRGCVLLRRSNERIIQPDTRRSLSSEATSHAALCCGAFRDPITVA
jgi:hypothetical protein